MSDFKFNDDVKIQEVKRFDEWPKDLQVQNAFHLMKKMSILNNVLKFYELNIFIK